MKLRDLVIFAATFLFAGAAQSGPEEFSEAFRVNLDQKLPAFSELQQKYAAQAQDYDKGYEFGWNIGTVFNEVFKNTITAYGSGEARIAPKNEEAFLNMLEAMPKQYYQYIGPYLHQVPGMSEKILNMPGIKETKNQFPTRIAPQLKHIENLEFLSPAFYFLLMPEAWPYTIDLKEYSLPKPVRVKVKPRKGFWQKLYQIVPMSEFAPDAAPSKKIGRSDLRTPNPDEYTLITAADVKAFADTLDKVNDFANQKARKPLLFAAGGMIDLWETEQGSKLPLNQLKDMVNPCQRLVQRVQLLGWENEFQMIVGAEGFNLKTWAYTCDKTIKAYRVSKMTTDTLRSIKLYQSRYYEAEINKQTPYNAKIHKATAAAFLQMHQAPLADVMEVRKLRPLLHDKFLKNDNSLAILPLSLF